MSLFKKKTKTLNGFLTDREIKKNFLINNPNSGGFIIGNLNSDVISVPSSSLPNHNVLSFGRSRSEKYRHIIEPNIYQSIKRGESFIAVSIDDSSSFDLAVLNGYKTILIDLNNPDKSAGWDLISEIASSKSPVVAADKALSIADAIWTNSVAPSSEPVGYSFWHAQNIALLGFLLLYVSISPSYEGPRNIDGIFSVLDEINNLEEVDGKLVYVYDEKIARIKAESRLGGRDVCVLPYMAFKESGHSRKLIPTALANRLSKLRSEPVKNLLSKNDLVLQDVFKEKTAVYIKLKENDSFDFITSSVITAFSSDLAGATNKYIKVKTTLFLDDINEICKIPNLSRILASANQNHLSICLTFNDVDALIYKYTDWNEIVKACAIKLFSDTSGTSLRFINDHLKIYNSKKNIYKDILTDGELSSLLDSNENLVAVINYNEFEKSNILLQKYNKHTNIEGGI